jgi:choline-glycine betaine transporter
MHVDVDVNDAAGNICQALDWGSYVDDILAAQGLPNPPIIQKIFWALTEGAVATALLKAGGSNALGRAVQVPPIKPTF